MQLAAFEFPFDPTLVALQPAEPRDAARLMRVGRDGRPIEHHRIADLPTLLLPGDLLVLNDTRVLPVRVHGRKRSGGGGVEVVFVRDLQNGIWEALVGGAKPGQVIEIDAETTVSVLTHGLISRVRVEGARPLKDVLEKHGTMPLPPYIKRPPMEQDRLWYQTTYAKQEGAIAAPTAGLHFTDRLLAALAQRGVQITFVTLHIGPGTFLPVRTTEIEQHRMMPERFEITPEAAAVINQARRERRRVIAVGTTVVRTLETVAGPDGTVPVTKGETDLFVVPGHQFRAVQGLLTNLHLPRSTLLMLVAAFGGLDRMREAYDAAIRERYRFYSYGDAMLIL